MAVTASIRFSQASMAAFLLVAILVSGLFLVLVPWGIALLLPTAVALVVLIGLVVALSPSNASRDSLLAWTLFSFALHVAVGSLITYTDLVHYFGPDALGYHSEAMELARQWRGSTTEISFIGGKEGFYYMLAGLYWLVGPHPIAGLVVNAACAAALIPVSVFITVRLFGPGPARWVPPLLTLTPAFLIWPSQLLREGPILLLIAVAAACAVSVTTRMRALPVIALVASLLLLFTFRSSVALLMAAGLLVGVAFGLRNLWVGISLQVVVLAAMIILVIGFGLGYSGFRVASEVDLEDVAAFRSATAQFSGSAIPVGDVSSFGGAIISLPVGVARVILGPFPWEIGVRQLPALVDGVMMWVLFFPLLVGIRWGWRRRGRALFPLFIPAALLSALLAVVVGNYGLLLRERTQMMVLLVPLFAVGLQRLTERRRELQHPRITTEVSSLAEVSP